MLGFAVVPTQRVTTDTAQYARPDNVVKLIACFVRKPDARTATGRPEATEAANYRRLLRFFVGSDEGAPRSSWRAPLTVRSQNQKLHAHFSPLQTGVPACIAR